MRPRIPRVVVEGGATRIGGVPGGPRAPLLIFDGDCGFCTTAAHWAQSQLRHGERVEAWQLLGPDVLESFGLSLRDVEQAAWWIDSEGRPARGHRAAGKVLQAAGGWHRTAGWLVLTPPSSWVAAGVYRLVVRWRYRLPGGTPACRVAGKQMGDGL